jgi:RNA polymerase sigma-70 factor (ECF subfamily)
VTRVVDDLTPLLAAAADGDRRALEELIARSQSDVWRFCAGLLDRSLADDATQETFVRVWRSVRTFRGEASARTWLLSIARRVCYDQVRRRRSTPRLAPGPARDAPVADTSGAVDIDDLIARLSTERRAAFVLTQVLGYSYQEAAQVCGCPVGTIRSRVARARAELLAGYEEI